MSVSEETILSSITGKVKWFNNKAGYGFITVSDDGAYMNNDIFTHYTAIKVTNMAMEVMGGSGYKSGAAIERCYRDARAGTLMNPSNNTLKMILGRLELGIGLPWE